ncbi:RagB/SusD family nutrient uptake outer membrane protein [Prevotella sp. 10(H)]|uniref:RagB/SusD family nutrient uptake outer membrane protein n=1 Tax=Prevotella sp. 10(H) TaxID=1158294 RepID=UPI0004A76295|nr:RagB/SusD family nutrient uptake outer membrane protein [Prevotella sp. 10(H)]
MKNLYIYLILIILSIISISCEDFLTKDNPGSFTTDDKWWETEENARNALQIAYQGLPEGTSGRNAMLIIGLSDEAVGRQNYSNDYPQFTKSLQNSDWGVALHMWQDNYINIRSANRLLENIHRVYMTNEELKKRYIHEAKALRAFHHMELLLYFGGIPIVQKTITPAENKLARNTEEECYNFIISEFREAANGLPAKYDPADKERISKAACWALISRLALHYHKYDIAAEYAKKIMDLRETDGEGNPTGSPLYELWPDYSTLFTYSGNNDNNKERIMIRSYGCRDAWQRFAPHSLGGEISTSPTNSAVNNFETKQGKTIYELGEDSLAIYIETPNYKNNRDPRFGVSVLCPGEIYDGQELDPFSENNLNLDRIGLQHSTSTGFWVKKYLDTRDRYGGRSLDYMLIRYAEVLLNYVEALIESGDWKNPDVITYLNMIRNRAKMPDVNTSVYNTLQKLRELVRRERQAETAFEGRRFYDIRRWNIANTVMNGQVYGAFNPITGQPYEVEVRKYRPERDIRFPIPRGEITSNPNMKQNPGY